MRPVHAWMLIAPLLILMAATIEGVLLERVRGHYDWRAYFASAGDLGLRILLGVLPLGLAGAALTHLWDYRLYTMPLAAPWAWALLFVGQDFFYYWMHRADHRVRWLWATHSVHHSPNELNLSAAYRLGFTARLSIAPLFFAPLVLIGFPPTVVAAALALNLLYQFWLHAPWIRTLGPLEWVMNTPAHHRIHHACNPEYLDANFGGVFIVFDRIFKTFRSEIANIPVRYGLVDPIHSYNPLRVGLNEWSAILHDVRRARSVRECLVALLGTPAITNSINQENSMTYKTSSLEISSRIRFTLTMSTMLAVGSLAALNADAQTKTFQQAGPRGGIVNASTSQHGNKISGSATATAANGKTATASGVVTIKPGSLAAQGTATGPNGGTATGTATAANGTVTATGTATSKTGQTVGGTATATQGSATLTNTAGNSKTFSSSNRPPRR